MIRRIVWPALMALLSVIAVGVQLDRQSRRVPELAHFVPAPFRGYASWTTALSALERKDTALAQREARVLVRRRPVPGEHLTVLAQVHQARAEPELTVRTILLAGSRSWRSEPIQQTVLRMAHDAGEDAEAARRLAALWAIGGNLSGTEPFARKVLSTPAGLDAFAGQLATTNTWQAAFLRVGAARLGSDLHARVIRAAADRGAAFDCQLLSGAALALADAGKAQAAADIWTGRCASASQAGGVRSGFTPEPAGASGPFDWHYPQAPSVRLDFRQGAEGWIIDFENGSLARQVLASRRAALAPGRHDLVLTAQSGDKALFSEVACPGGRGQLLGRRLGAGALSFTVPAADCPVQLIRVHAFPGAGTGLGITLRDQ